MRRRSFDFRWEIPEAQQVFAEWLGFGDEALARTQVDEMEALLGIRPSLEVVDIGCGTGRHSLELARRGYRVTGIDVAQTYLDVAKTAAEQRRLPVIFRKQRGSQLRERERFVVAIAFNHTLGFMSDSELRKHFRCIHASLKPGGRLLLVLAGPKTLPNQEVRSRRSWAEKEGKFILGEHTFRDGYRFETSIVIDTMNDEVVEFHEKQRAFSLAQVATILDIAGFVHIERFRDLTGSPATDEDFGVFLCHRGK